MKQGLLIYCVTAIFCALLTLSGPAWADEVPGGDQVGEFGEPGDLYGDDDLGGDDSIGDPAGDDSAGDAAGGEEPSYTNAAQAHHAANLQQQALANDPELNEEADKVAEAESNQQTASKDLQDALAEKESYFAELEEAEKKVAEAQQAYEEALAAGDPDATQKALDDLNAAKQGELDAQNDYDGAVSAFEGFEEAYQNALQETETAQERYAEMLGERTGVLAEEIADMRQVQKMGWGEIAHFLGVEPKYLGRKLGHTKNWKSQTGVQDPIETDDLISEEPTTIEQELAEVTKRNVKNGWSNSHGMKSSSANSAKDGIGLAKSSGKAAADAKGNKGTNGNNGNKSGSSSSAQPGSSGKSQKGGVSSKGSSNNSSKDKSPGNSSSSSSSNNGSSNNGKSGNDGKSGNSGNNGNNGKSGDNNGKGGGKKK